MESDKTAFLFVANIVCMILVIFALFGTLVITFIVWFAGEEIEMLHEAPEIDSSLFLHELSRLITLVPFILMTI